MIGSLRITVIVPVYNVEKYLEKCIKSITDQTYKNLEIICVNDGSTDNSLQILTELSVKDLRIKVISQENSGVSAARNAGLDIASGDYITFVDSDDELEPDMYEVLVSLAEKYNADIAHCGYKKVHFDGSTKDVCGTGQLLVQNSAEASSCLLSGQHFTGSLCNKLYRSSLLGNIRFDTALKINEDVLFNAQMFKKADSTVFFDVPKYYYFERKNSACFRTTSIRKKQDSVIAAEEILRLYENTELKPLAAGKLYYCLLDLYRAYLFDGIRKNQNACDTLHLKVCGIEQLCREDSQRSRKNYKFMRRFPVLYKVVYSIYDRIRKPNWDL